ASGFFCLCSYNPLMQFDQITIVGVGLIGGSVGLAAKARHVARRVVGVDRDAAKLGRAAALGVVDVGTTDLAECVAGSLLVVVCTPVDKIEEVIIHAAPPCKDGTIFTDAGSVKGGLYEAVQGTLGTRLTFIPAHPLAGAETSGPEHARAEMFENRVTVITPHEPERDVDAVTRVVGFWQSLGSRIIKMRPAEHDRDLAITSHLPHAVAAAVAGSTSPELLSLTASGFRDLTRIAASSPELWTAIFQANRDALLSALTAFTDRLAEFRRLLEA